MMDCPYDLFDPEDFYLEELKERNAAKQVRHVDDFKSFCPNCEDVRVNSSMPFCWLCGQRLKW